MSVLTPMFILPSQDAPIAHFRAIAHATSLPVVLYSNPPKTGVGLTAATVKKLADVPNIVGIKDSSGDFTLTAEYLRLTRGKELHVLLGRDMGPCVLPVQPLAEAERLKLRKVLEGMASWGRNLS